MVNAARMGGASRARAPAAPTLLLEWALGDNSEIIPFDIRRDDGCCGDWRQPGKTKAVMMKAACNDEHAMVKAACIDETEMMGHSSNAYTASENTNYHFDLPPDHFEGALDRSGHVQSSRVKSRHTHVIPCHVPWVTSRHTRDTSRHPVSRPVVPWVTSRHPVSRPVILVSQVLSSPPFLSLCPYFCVSLPSSPLHSPAVSLPFLLHDPAASPYSQST